MATQVILLERVEKLGAMGDVVSVKPGYARNYLLPQKKALRASKENIAYFEGKKKHLEAESAKAKTEAEKLAKKIDGVKVPLVRQASESGHLYGSVNARDIAEQIIAKTKQEISRNQVQLNQNFKTIGLFPVPVVLHPEVKAEVIVNIARSEEEAKIQDETGRAMISEDLLDEVVEEPKAEESLEEVLEEEALEAKKVKDAEDAEKAVEEAAKAEARAKAKAEKAAAKVAEEAVEADEEAKTEE